MGHIQRLYKVSAALEEENILVEVIEEYEEKLAGGLADQLRPSNFDRSQILKGLEVEMEHTNNPMLAIEIAMDHLTEIPNYYDYLEAMEKEALTEGLVKAEVKMALASLGVEVVNNKIKKLDLHKILAKKEPKRGLIPPKKWWDKMVKEIGKGNPSYNKEQIDSTIGDIWYHQLDDVKRKELREKEGKEYGPTEVE